MKKIPEIVSIPFKINPVDLMTKENPTFALKKLIEKTRLILRLSIGFSEAR